MNKPAIPVLQSSNSLAGGLLRCIAFTEGSGSTLTDSSSVGANLTTRTNFATAPANWNVDPNQGSYVNFDGATQDAVGPDTNLPTGNAARTFAFLFRSSIRNTKQNLYFFSGYGTSGDSAFAMGLAGSTSIQPFWVTTLTHGSGGTVNEVDGQWHLGHAILDGSDNLSLFMDGQQIATSSSTGSALSTVFKPVTTALSGKFFLGQIGGNSGSNPDSSLGNTSNGYTFNGDLAGVWAWNRALSATDVANHSSDPWQMVRPIPTVSSVSVSPATATVVGGTTQQFNATVTGKYSPAQTVTWTTSAGSISASGVLTAPPVTNAAQSITVTATSTVDPTKSGTASVTVPAAIPPSIGPVTVTSADGVDLISYPVPTVGSRPVVAVSLLVGTTPGGESSTPVAINIGGGAGQFAYPTGGYSYTLIATDAGTPALVSAPSAEVRGANNPRGLPTTFAQTTAIVRNALSTFFTPDLLAGLAKLKANALEVDILSIAGSNVAASNFRDQAINQTATLNAFGSVVATQLQASFPSTLLAGLNKLTAPTIDVNVVQFAGSATAASNLRDEELSQTISTTTVNAIGAATAAKLTIPSATDTATAVWSNATRTLTSSSSSPSTTTS